MLEQIGYNISRLKRYPQLYPDNNVLNQAMAHVYRHIFLFCEKARAAFGEGKRKKEKSKIPVYICSWCSNVFLSVRFGRRAGCHEINLETIQGAI